MQNSDRNNDDYWVSIYFFGFFITGLLTFGGIWIYSFDEWGLLFGLVFGWLPALIGGVIAGAIWPLIAIGLLFIFLSNS